MIKNINATDDDKYLHSRVQMVFGFVLVLVLFFGAFLLIGGKVEARTITVDVDGEGDYIRIQDAIDNATDGDTIRVWEGNYTEGLSINKSISLSGNGSSLTHLNSPGGPYKYTVIVDSKWVNVSGIQFNGIGGVHKGILLSSNHSKIFLNTFQNCYRGIMLKNSMENQIENNLFENNYMGMYFENSHHNNASGNRFIENDNQGLYFFGSKSNTINMNNFTNNRDGIIFHNQSHSNNILSNTFQNNTGFGMVITGKSSLNTIRNNSISNSKSGIELHHGDRNVLFGNIIDETDFGIHMVDSLNTSVTSNIVIRNNIGIHLVSAHYCTINSNEIVFNTEGISLPGVSYRVMIHGNNIYGNERWAVYASPQFEDPIDARNNYWGDASGPRNLEAEYSGKGDNITGNIIVSPWYEDQVKENLVNTDWDKDDGSLFIPTAIAMILSVSLLGIALHREDFRFLLLTLLAFPLYSRMERSEILDQSTRNNIYTQVVNEQGLNYSTIKKKLELGTSSLVYHLEVLEREGYIRSKKEMGRKMFFPTRMVQSMTMEEKLSSSPSPLLSPSPIQDQILEYLKENGPQTRTKLKDALSLKQQTISYSIRSLEKKGLVKTGGKGWNRLCEFIKQ